MKARIDLVFFSCDIILIMKEIVFNESNLMDSEINRLVKRAKLLLISPNNEFLLCYSSGTYHILGGHVDGDETNIECIVREVKEEAGMDIIDTNFTPIVRLIYYCKDYPEVGTNSKYVADYYYQKTAMQPHMENAHLTEDEKSGHFCIKKIPKDKILDILKQEYQITSRKNVMRDTILVIKEYLKSN